MRLDPETLAVDSFAAGTATVEVRGTVQGNARMAVTVRVTCYTCGEATCVESGSPCVAC